MIKRFGCLAFALLVAIFVGSTLMSCGGDRPASGQGTEQINDVVDYGNGVFYFPYHYTGQGEFGRTFSAWRAQHPKWIIIAVTPSQDRYGYYVIANPDL